MSFRKFSKASIWIQIQGLLINDKIPQMEIKLGEKLGESCEVALFQMQDRFTIIKITFKISMEKLIKLGMYIGNTSNGVNWIDF